MESSIYRKLLVAILCMIAINAKSATLWLETESFDNPGGWVLDQQFMDCMGSPYLLAHGMGCPVEDASKEIEIPEDGQYTVWVRTFNWTSPWYQGEGPGRFRVLIDRKALNKDLGSKGDKWYWQKAGTITLKKGHHNIALHDLTGFDGRCDAIVLTNDPQFQLRLPDQAQQLAALRNQLNQVPSDSIANYDFVVVGGGIAGMCAAISAARLGSHVALINDRPVLGGNNSSEVRVHLGGHIELGPNPGLGRLIREFGHTQQGNAQPASVYQDWKKDSIIASEPLIDYYPGYHANAVECNPDGTIKSVISSNITSGRRLILSAPIFGDCTGDGTVGYLAGAHYMMGRESKDQYCETLAPEVADSIVMGASIQWYSTDTGKKSTFPVFDFGGNFTADNCERTTMGEWKWETGMNQDQINEAETIRDYGLLVVYSNWSVLKNVLKDPRFQNRSLQWVAYIAGKRESRRLIGDYVLKQDDIDKCVSHEDASFTASWAIDLHFPDSINSQRFPGREFKAATIHRYIYPCPVPYRCLYSRNVDNLLMAGRNISVTHVALGTVRVMRTTGMMGEVIGMAADICRRHSTTPRGVYQNHLPELKDLMYAGIGHQDVPQNQDFNVANHLLPQPKAFMSKE